MLQVVAGSAVTAHNTARVADRVFRAARASGKPCAVLVDGAPAETANGYPEHVSVWAADKWTQEMLGGKGIGR